MDKVNLITLHLNMLLNMIEQPSREKAMVSRWKREIEVYGGLRENRMKVLNAVRDGYDTLTEIASHTRLPKSTCYVTLHRLVDENAIVKKTARNSNNRMESRFESRVEPAPNK